MSIRARLGGLEKKQARKAGWVQATMAEVIRALSTYRDPEEVPNELLDAYVRLSYREGNHSREEADLYRLIEEGGFKF